MSIGTIVLAWRAAALIAGGLWALAGWLWGRRGTRGGGKNDASALALITKRPTTT